MKIERNGRSVIDDVKQMARWSLNKAEIGARIKELRNKNGLTQDEVADELHLSKAAISQIERGKNGISPENACALAELFDVSIDQLYKGDLIKNTRGSQLKGNKNCYDFLRGCNVRYSFGSLSYPWQESKEELAFPDDSSEGEEREALLSSNGMREIPLVLLRISGADYSIPESKLDHLTSAIEIVRQSAITAIELIAKECSKETE